MNTADFSTSLSAKLEALIIASDEPLSLARMRDLTDTTYSELRAALSGLQDHYRDRGICLHEVAGGWQFRSASAFSDTVQQLWQMRPPRLSRSMLETLSIIAYRQPTTRGEIEMLRGVKVSSSIIGGLQERGWIKVLGRKEVPGRPHLYGTSKTFLIDFGLNSLADLPEIAQLMDQEELEAAARSQAESQLEDRTEEQAEEQTEDKAEYGVEDSADEHIPTNADNQHEYEENDRESGPESEAEAGENQAFESTQGECRESESAAAERR